MEIVYKQTMPSGALLDSFGIQNCYCKHLFAERDKKMIIRKLHYHTDYEIHIVEKGSLIYRVENTRYELKCGHFLLISPKLLHQVIYRAPGTSTVSITFSKNQDKSMLQDLDGSISGELSPRMWDTIQQILKEKDLSQVLTAQAKAIRILEILVLLWRLCGVKKVADIQEKNSKDTRLALAKQYIADNIEFAPTISEVSAYCHISAKQLGRLFVQAEGITPSAYIQKQKIARIQMLLCNNDLSLQTISERMHFSTEYYFNSFYKKHAGMAPGEFRKMHT